MANTVATQPTQKAQPINLRATLESGQFKAAIAKVLPRHVTPERMTRIAISALTRVRNLSKCTEASFLRCMMDLSQWGIEPDGRRAHLIPFWNSTYKCYECTLIIDYKGLAELAIRSGTVSYIHCSVVCDNDQFEYDRGELIRHKIDFKNPRGDIYAVYCLIRMKDGGAKCEAMSVTDIDAIRDKTQAYQAFKEGKIKSTPWEDDWEEMAKKTVFRRASKWIPLSAEVHAAAEVDDRLPAETITVQAQSAESIVDLSDRLTQFQDDDDLEHHTQTDTPETKAIESAPVDDNIEDKQAANTIYLEFVASIDGMDNATDIGKAITSRRQLIQTSEWDNELKAETIGNISKAAKQRIEEIKSKRGPRSNELFEGEAEVAQPFVA